MAAPKHKKSRANTRTHRAHWKAKAKAPDLVPIVVDGKRILVPRRLVAHFQRSGH